jgi:hypothetical protein
MDVLNAKRTLLNQESDLEKFSDYIIENNQKLSFLQDCYSILKLLEDPDLTTHKLSKHIYSYKALARHLISFKSGNARIFSEKINKSEVTRAIQILGINETKTQVEEFLIHEYLLLAKNTKNAELQMLYRKSARLAMTVIYLNHLYKDIIPKSDTVMAALNMYQADKAILKLNPVIYFEAKKMSARGIGFKSAINLLFNVDTSALARHIINSYDFETTYIIKIMGNQLETKEKAILDFAKYLVENIKFEYKCASTLWKSVQPYLISAGLKLDRSNFENFMHGTFFKMIKLEKSI